MSRSQQDHIWSNKYFGRHFLIDLRHAWTYFNETCHNYSLCLNRSKIDMTYDIFKVMDSKVKVADISENALQHLSGGGITIDGSPSKTTQFYT